MCTFLYVFGARIDENGYSYPLKNSLLSPGGGKDGLGSREEHVE